MDDKKKKTGKKAEMLTARAICDIALKEDRCDFTRNTITNTPDLGADLILHCPENTGEKFKEIAKAGESSMVLVGKSTQIRIDVKDPKDKVQKDDAIKFVGDIRKHPLVSEHWLVGGESLTAPAKKYIEANTDWANVRYFSQNDIEKIAAFYQALPDPSDE
ncbi:hypothetical protein [Oceanisphaera sp. W20_SRM_FM3]|uniref:hypothetical protein n=1 Tax=Oceanisphaera sp. W20_SRM_FM3 TaxID=3240267 RepID=UPI003F98C709